MTPKTLREKIARYLSEPFWDVPSIRKNSYELTGQILSLIRKALPEAEIQGAVARGWCHKETEHLTMNATLAIAISREVISDITRLLGGEV